MGLGSLGGGTQLLFGGSGGQDLFQKVTWGMGIAFMVASLLLAILKKPSQSQLLGQLAQQQQATQAASLPKIPTQPITQTATEEAKTTEAAQETEPAAAQSAKAEGANEPAHTA